MDKRNWMQWMLSSSDKRPRGRKSKSGPADKNLKWAGFLAVFLVGCVVVADAQQPKKIYRIGYLSPSDPATDSAGAEAIRLALRELGYVDGRNITIEYRYAGGGEARSVRSDWNRVGPSQG
jgi:hypothetical protein